ncbi:hypothetical protein Tco_1068986 [Tanacetum coccineum]|uniref:Uncharacterized protein n=1 Tax=Tanacetum coccineum TaxID=301880 RepID=A0ABQ5HIP7_9ASTR
MTLPETIKTNSSLLKGKMWHGHTLQDLVRGNRTEDLNLCVPNAITTMTVHVLQNATSTTELAIWPVIIKGNFKRECPKLKNNNRGNPVGSGNAPAKVYVVGNAGTNPDSNVDSEDSTVTYTEVSNPFVDLSDIGSPRVDGPPVMPEDPYAYVVADFQAPPSPDYVPGPEELEQAPPLPDFVPEPVYPEFMPLEDEVLPAEEQPLPTAALPTADSPGYVPESDPEEDPEEDDDEDPEEDPADYPADRGDDGDDEDESSDDDEDDDVDIEEDEEEDTQLLPTLQLLRSDCPKSLGDDLWKRVTLRETDVITEMLAADSRRQKQFTEALKLMKGLQTEMAELQR